MEIKVNDNLKMLTDSDWWAKGDVGRLVQISYNRHGKPYILFVLIQTAIKCITAMADMCGMSDLMPVSYTGQID